MNSSIISEQEAKNLKLFCPFCGEKTLEPMKQFTDTGYYFNKFHFNCLNKSCNEMIFYVTVNMRNNNK